MKRFIPFLILTLAVFAFTHGLNAATKLTQKLPLCDVPIPQSEQMLKGEVVRMVETAKLPPPEEGMPRAERNYAMGWKKVDERTYSIAWQKVAMDDAVAVPGMTFLMPHAEAFEDVKPYCANASRPGETDICFVFPLDRKDLLGMSPWVLARYDAQGRILAFQSFSWLDLLTSAMSSFRYEFHYDGENDANCREVKLFHKNPRIKTEEEIGYMRLQCEAGLPVQYLSGGASYFFSDEKTKLIYGDHGFLTAKITYDGHGDDANPAYMFHYQNYEHDRHGNWTSRGVYVSGQLLGVETREIVYAE